MVESDYQSMNGVHKVHIIIWDTSFAHSLNYNVKNYRLNMTSSTISLQELVEDGFNINLQVV